MLRGFKMGTRAIIHIKESGLSSPTIVSIYKQYDGYPSGLGQKIINLLNYGKSEIVNGFGTKDEIPQSFNGMGCMAAWLIGQFKGCIGDVYIVQPDTEDWCPEFVYTLFEENGEIQMVIRNTDATLAEGPLRTINTQTLEVEQE
jgi:hypothetical protein